MKQPSSEQVELNETVTGTRTSQVFNTEKLETVSQGGKKQLFKRSLIVDILMFALAFSFAAQICLSTPSVSHKMVGVVYGADGPLAGVFVYAEGDNGSGYAATDSSGHYSMTTGLQSGTYNLTTFAYGYIDGEVDLVNVTAGSTTSGVNFDIQASGGISGTVTDAANGNPINGTELFADLSNGSSSSFGWFGTTGTDGKYLIATNLPTGTYNITMFTAPEGFITSSATADVVAGVETKNVDLQLAESGIISGRITAPNGTGLFDISVTAFSSDYSHFGSATTDASGNYRIGNGLATENYTVSASGAGNSTIYGASDINFLGTPVPVTAGQETSGINMELTPVTAVTIPSGTITGRITDQNNNPISFATVSASGSNGSGSADTDKNGDYSISSGLQTGNDYNVSVTAHGYYDAYYQSLVSVTEGQTTSGIDIQMAAKPAETYGTITGTVIGSPNPITKVPEFQYPLMALLSATLVVAVASRIMIKTRRYKNTGITQ